MRYELKIDDFVKCKACSVNLVRPFLTKTLFCYVQDRKKHLSL